MISEVKSGICKKQKTL